MKLANTCLLSSLLLVLSLTSTAKGQKVTALTEETSPELNDVFPFVHDADGTPVTKKVKLGTITCL
jgi:hypothetical protein